MFFKNQTFTPKNNSPQSIVGIGDGQNATTHVLKTRVDILEGDPVAASFPQTVGALAQPDPVAAPVAQGSVGISKGGNATAHSPKTRVDILEGNPVAALVMQTSTGSYYHILHDRVCCQFLSTSYPYFHNKSSFACSTVSILEGDCDTVHVPQIAVENLSLCQLNFDVSSPPSFPFQLQGQHLTKR